MAKKYSDFSLSFTPHPITGDISMVSDEVSINQALKNLILTNTYEVPFLKNQAGNIQKLLFDLATPATAASAEARIRTVIENYEPRVDIIDIRVLNNSNKNRLEVTIVYSAKTSTENITAQFYIDRIV